ncbi:hypothetical protein FNF31_05671 [Cafeteria roenbergensis]|uniref:Peptidase S1 domain-containing protein n=1 Tax=Cafeteria roenbergensis TaxID=33653 RepID=A0A5A8DLF9_CAFRO|nr:hypothetical protein FNF31_05671 [Cafeteria roenbergensis]KAA0164651.1 hypothetical protein FNF28_03712 [Cafeteria roenbergensis]
MLGAALWLGVLAAAASPAAGLIGATNEGEASAETFPGVVLLRGGAVDACTGTFVAENVVVTNGRCVVHEDDEDQPIDTGVAGEWASEETMFVNLTVWGGAGTGGGGLQYVGRASNVSWVYRTGVFGDNIAVVAIELHPEPQFSFAPIPLRTEAFVLPESGAIVGYGSDQNFVTGQGQFVDAGVHRSGPAELLEATEVFDYSGNCLLRKNGGALVLQDYNSRTFPKTCLASGDFGAALLIRNPVGDSDEFQLAAVAAQGDTFPCTTVRTYLSSVIYRQNWLIERINFFKGNPFEPIVCASATPTSTAVPTVTASPSVAASPSTTPSPIVQVLPERSINWGIIIILGLILLCLCGSACATGLYYKHRVMTGKQTAVTAEDTIDEALGERSFAKRMEGAPLAGSVPTPKTVPTPEDVDTQHILREERRVRAAEARKGREGNREAIKKQKAMQAMKKRSAAFSGEATRHVRVGGDAMHRFGGPGNGEVVHIRQQALASTAAQKPQPGSNEHRYQGTGPKLTNAAPGSPVGATARRDLVAV